MRRYKKRLIGCNIASSGMSLDSSMGIIEETRFRKKYQKLTLKLSKKLHFTYQEVECLLIIYYKLQNSNNNKLGIHKTQFWDILHCSLNMTDDALMDRIFYFIEKGSSSPFLSMETWATNLSLFLRGTIEEKINFCFMVYDVLGEGILGKEVMFNLLRKSFPSLGDDEDAEETVQEYMETIIKKMDIDRDGRISFNDYRQSVLKEPVLLQVFGQCLPTRRGIHTFLTTFSPNLSEI